LSVLKSISIKGFRGIKECTIENLGNVNVLIGRNGAGKSTVLEAIYASSAWVNSTDNLRGYRKIDYIIERRAGRGKWVSSRYTLWYLMDVEKDIEIKLDFTGNKELSFKLVSKDVEGNVWLLLPPSLRRELGKRWESYVFYNYFKDKFSSPKLRIISRENIGVKEIFEKHYGDSLRFLEDITFIDSWLLSRPNIVENKVWPKILARRLDKLIVKTIREGYGIDAEGLTYMPIGGIHVLALQLPKTTIRIDDLGDGIKNAILASATMLPLEKTAVLIEDPEIHQHPGGLATLMNFTMRIAKEKHLQLFISTHSIELVRIVNKLCGEIGLECRTFFLERSGDGIVDVRILEKIDIDTLLKLGLDPRLLHII